MKTPSWEQLTLMMSSLNQTLNNKIGEVKEIITTNTPHQQLVTDEEGNVKWEKKTHWIELKEPFEVLPETQLSRETIEDPMLITTPLATEVIPNNTYVVTLNGIEYTCVAQMIDDGTMVLPVLGNIGLTAPELFPNTGEPFMFAAVPPGIPDMEGVAGMLMVFDEEILEATFKIVGFNQEIVYKLNPKFVSSPDWDAAEGEEGHIKNRTHWIEKKGVVIYETTSDSDPEIINPLIEGNTYSVIWNGEEYFCVAKKTTIGDITGIYLGNIGAHLGSQYKTNDPFAIIYTETDGVPEISIGNANPDNLSPFTVQITEVEIHKLNPNFLEPSNWNASEGQLGYIANRTHWVEEAKEIFPPTTIKIEDPGDELESWMFEVEGGWPFTIEIGREYRVKYKDQTYDIVAKPHMVENLTVWVLGNSELQYLLGDIEPTGYDCPFLFIGLDGMQGWLFVDRNEPLEPVTISINELNPVYHKLSQNFLPDYIYGYENDEVGGEVLPETVLTPAGGVLAYIETPFTEQLVDGQTYVVNYNNQSYECVAKEVSSFAGLENPSYALGNLQSAGLGSEGSDIPFVLIKFLIPITNEDSGTTITYTGLLQLIDSTNDVVTLGVTKKQGKIIKVPEKFLPAYNWNAKESQEGHILNRTHWYHPEENHTWDSIIEGKENVLLTSVNGYFGSYKFSDTFLTKADLLTARVSVNGELLEEQPTEEDFKEHKNGKAICYSIENLTIWSISQDVCGSVFKPDRGDAAGSFEVISAIYPSPGLYITGLNTHLSGTTVTLTIPESLKKLDPMFLPEISSVEIDPTLTVEGAAADAKAVGDALAAAGGGGLPAGGEPHQQLVTDKDGETVWADLTHYTEAAEAVVLEQTTLTVNMDEGMAYLTTPPVTDPTDNGRYTVHWNGTEYECISTMAEVDGISVVLIGNAMPIGGNDTGEPFMIIFFPVEMAASMGYAWIAPLDGSEEVTISIAGVSEVVHKLHEKYLPPLPTNLVNGSGYMSLRTKSTVEENEEYRMGQYAIALGDVTKASGECSHAEGQGTDAIGRCSHAEGAGTTASGGCSHAEGNATQASGEYSHAEGSSTQANGEYSHAEGNLTKAVGSYSHAEGQSTEANGTSSHAEGQTTTARGEYSHAEGYGTRAIGSYSHAEGNATQANGHYSHAEGHGTKATGADSHAEGISTTASGNCSHTEGHHTEAAGSYSHVQGKYNIVDTEEKYAHIVGNGEAPHQRSNAHTLDWNGNAWFAGEVYVGGTSQDDGEKLVTESELAAAVSSGGTVSTKYKQPDWGVEESEVVLPETEIAFDPESGEGALTNPLLTDLVVGETYSVYINGEMIALCVAKTMTAEGIGDTTTLSNFDVESGLMEGVEKPFIFVQLPAELANEMGMYAMVMLYADGETSATIQIKKATTHKIPESLITYTDTKPQEPLILRPTGVDPANNSFSIGNVTSEEIEAAIKSGRAIYYKAGLDGDDLDAGLYIATYAGKVSGKIQVDFTYTTIRGGDLYVSYVNVYESLNGQLKASVISFHAS